MLSRGRSIFFGGSSDAPVSWTPSPGALGDPLASLAARSPAVEADWVPSKGAMSRLLHCKSPAKLRTSPWRWEIDFRGIFLALGRSPGKAILKCRAQIGADREPAPADVGERWRAPRLRRREGGQ